MLTLYFAPGASSMAPHIALHEVGAPFESRPLSFKRRRTATRAFLAINPEGKVPTLTDRRAAADRGRRRSCSIWRGAIPEADLLPAGDIEAEAQVVSWMSFIAATIHPARRQGLEHARTVYDDSRAAAGRTRVGGGALLDRRHPSVPAVLAVPRFAESGARASFRR